MIIRCCGKVFDNCATQDCGGCTPTSMTSAPNPQMPGRLTRSTPPIGVQRDPHGSGAGRYRP